MVMWGEEEISPIRDRFAQFGYVGGARGMVMLEFGTSLFSVLKKMRYFLVNSLGVSQIPFFCEFAHFVWHPRPNLLVTRTLRRISTLQNY
jgi:hypothetical protein